MLKKKSIHSLYFDKDCRTLATSKAKISQCIIAFLRNNPSVLTLLLMNSTPQGARARRCRPLDRLLRGRDYGDDTTVKVPARSTCSARGAFSSCGAEVLAEASA
jgi:hypothetical protein